MTKFRSAVLAFASLALAAIAAPVSAQVITTPTDTHGWNFGDGKPGIPPSPAQITTANSHSGDGSLQLTVTNGSQQPEADYLFASAVSLSSFVSGSFDFAGDPAFNSPTGGSPTYRLLLTGISNAGPTSTTTFGSLGWYGTPTTSTDWMTQDFSKTEGNFFLRVGGAGHGQASDACTNTTYSQSFDDRRQTIGDWLLSCDGVGTDIDLTNTQVVGVEVDYGSFGSGYTGTSTVYADNVTFRFGTDTTSAYNFETDAPSSATPEPGTLPLLATGLASMGGIGFRQRRRTKSA